MKASDVQSFDNKLFGILAGAKTGISCPRLWSRWRIPTKMAIAFAERHSDVVLMETRRDQQQREKVFLQLRSSLPQAAVVGEVPTDVLEMGRDRLLKFLDHARSSEWLANVGLPMKLIEQICERYPEVRLNVVKRYPALQSDYIVSLVPPEPEPEPSAAQPVRAVVPKVQLTAEDDARMHFKPPSRGMSLRRGATCYPQNMINRRRYPLVKLPE